MWKRVTHGPCPACRERGQDTKGDNLGVYPDGGKFCFACGYRVSGDSLNLDLMTQKIVQNLKESSNKQDDSVALPYDYTRLVPLIALDWLRLYQITDAEIDKHKIGWSDLYERLIFPVYDAGHLIMWHGRLFSDAPKGRPKGLTEGFKDKAFYILGDISIDKCCLVEDIISAIKVSRYMPCMPIWGSVISTARLIGVEEMYNNLVIWLDYDKREYAAKRAIYARQFFKDVKVITTQFDPKAYNDEAIAQYVK